MFSKTELDFVCKKIASKRPVSLEGLLAILQGKNPKLADLTTGDLLDALESEELSPAVSKKIPQLREEIAEKYRAEEEENLRRKREKEQWDRMSPKEKNAANKKRKAERDRKRMEEYYETFPEEKQKADAKARGELIEFAAKVAFVIGIASLITFCVQSYDPDAGKTKLERDAERLCDAVGGCYDD